MLLFFGLARAIRKRPNAYAPRGTGYPRTCPCVFWFPWRSPDAVGRTHHRCSSVLQGWVLRHHPLGTLRSALKPRLRSI